MCSSFLVSDHEALESANNHFLPGAVYLMTL